MSKEDELKTIHEIIDMIRYYIQADGGDLFFVSYENGIVTLKITGNCVGCNIQDVTYKDGLLQILKLDLPNIKDVILIEEKSDINALWDEFDQQQVRTSPFGPLAPINNNSPIVQQQVKEIDLNNDEQVEIIDHTKKPQKQTKTKKTNKTKKATIAKKNKTTSTKRQKVSKTKQAKSPVKKTASRLKKVINKTNRKKQKES